MSVSKIEKASNTVLDKLQKGGGRSSAFDVSIITMIGEMIISLIERCRENNSPQAVATSANKPGFLQRLAVRRSVRQRLSRAQFRAYGNDMIEAVLDTGAEADQQEVLELISEVDLM